MQSLDDGDGEAVLDHVPDDQGDGLGRGGHLDQTVGGLEEREHCILMLLFCERFQVRPGISLRPGEALRASPPAPG